MKIISATFVTSSPNLGKCPGINAPEYAFIGRSNVGKSSLINMLVGRKNLAKTSGTPGKTQLINHFEINEEWYLVDLPGYGFARVPRAIREKWSGIIRNYLGARKNLVCTFILVDARIEPQNSDMELMEWMGESALPFAIVFTKMDKLSKTGREKQIHLFRKRLMESWEELPPIFFTSAKDASGRDSILDYIEAQNRIYDDFIMKR
jgi:GTP-binding protein